MFEMPKPLKKHNTELLDTYEEVAFHLKDGQCIQLQISRDIDTDLDNILIFTETLNEHQEVTRRVLEILQKHKLYTFKLTNVNLRRPQPSTSE